MQAHPKLFMCKVAVILACVPVVIECGSLLAGHVPASGDEWVSEDRLRSVLAEGLGVGGFNSEESSKVAQVEQVKAVLQPLFVALPKDQYGRLGRNTVRYALSRYFAGSIKGLDVASKPWNPSSALITQGQAAAYLLHRMEENVGGASFGLHELSVLAVAISQLKALETSDLLDAAWQVGTHPTADYLDRTGAEVVLETYMMAFILGRKPGELTSMDLRDLEKLRRGMGDVFPPWNQAFESARTTLSEIVSAEVNVNRTGMARVAAEATRLFDSTFQNTGCRELKDTLLKSEDGSSGRVSLPKFYQAAPSARWTWHFEENLEYLRALAVLDESDKKMGRVVVSNYVASEPNCIADTGMGSLCCRNECDTLFQKLEEAIAAPEAEPSRLLSLVETFSTSTVLAPRKLSASMKQRLESVAKRHDGGVPLHGRLFGQWMHHAFPRECPYPRVPSAGTSAEKARSDASAASLSATEASAMTASGSAQLGEGRHGVWQSTSTPSTSLRKELCRTVVLLLALAAVVVGLWRTMWTALLNSGLIDESHATALAPAQRAAAAAAAGTRSPASVTKERCLKSD